VSRLSLEIAFLVAVACLVAVARLDTVLVVAVMGAAWALVALAEWATERAAHQRNEAAFGRYAGPEGSWFAAAPREAVPEIARADGDSGAKLPPPRRRVAGGPSSTLAVRVRRARYSRGCGGRSRSSDCDRWPPPPLRSAGLGRPRRMPGSGEREQARALLDSATR
jgi:hypothetical protein